jgi:hypothetical protein
VKRTWLDTTGKTIIASISSLVTAIKSKTDNMPSDPASNTEVDTRASQTTADAIQAAATAIQSDASAIKNQTDKLPNLQEEVEWTTTPVSQQVASSDATNLTAGSITPTFPTGATVVRALLFANVHAANQSANAHHVSLKVQGQKAGGGYGDLLDLTAQPTLGLVDVDGAGDAWGGAVDVTALVDTSAVQYDFRFVVDSDDAHAINYTTGFVLAVIYHL